MIALAVVALAVAVGSALLSPLAPAPLSALAFAGVVAACALSAVELLWPERRPCRCACTEPRVQTLTVGKITAGAMSADLQVRAVEVDELPPAPAPPVVAPSVSGVEVRWPELDEPTGPLPTVHPRPYAPPVSHAQRS